MPLLTEKRVRDAARQITSSFQKSVGRVLREVAKAQLAEGVFDIFLSHSYDDKELVLGAAAILEGFGFDVYIDWVVDDLDRSRVTPAHAAILRKRMRQSKALLYLKSENSTDSTWMPWELGYFDALRGRVGILPVTRSTRREFDGNEYLGLYPYVDVDFDRRNAERLWINRSPKEYGQLREWLDNRDAIQKHAA